MKIAIVNGPNLNLLGRRNTALYGTQTLNEVIRGLETLFPKVNIEPFQSNHEGDIIDYIQSLITSGKDFVGMVINAGGYTHTSVAIRDVIELCTFPVVEVHITDISQREPFRRLSLLTDVCKHTIIGHGVEGYTEAVQWLLENNASTRTIHNTNGTASNTTATLSTTNGVSRE